ncbi:SDR family NAD(P)-dependent oxidoreductase [Hymenobacter volaticus]|uniref:SDR family NAD(P)-dependent oxidoreductase n=1 Tax=Hymenobacter volaticus TaxID=2932254 RepID=A0ABY4GEN3_9BACT|nr:SDR family NAD(P)-dependent oxidoreductase [Hymenobacter volaticus]UOQ69302.1 SDR family NAD(P)-dependent oxidoreductase [Hymenobacter volaticus]
MDITRDESVQQAVTSTLEKYGHLDVLVNNAGITGFGLLEATSIAQMKNLFEVNLFGVVRAYQAVLPSMRAHKSGLIINISSGFGVVATPFVVPYQMTKFGLEALTEGIRHEVKGYGIETVSVLPGPFPTEIGAKAASYGPDRPEVVAAYGPAMQTALEQFGGIMEGKITEYRMDAQEVADAVSRLIAMKDGTRPFQTTVNRMTADLEQEYADSKNPFKTIWMERMGGVRIDQCWVSLKR